MSERATGIFSDIHHEDGKVRVTLLHDPSVEGLDTAIYMDGSGSMLDEYDRTTGPPPARPTAPPTTMMGKLWHFLNQPLGGSSDPVANAASAAAPSGVNIVDPQIRRMLQYLATKDRNAQLRVAYWACGNESGVEVVGELTAADLEHQRFDGPKVFGTTYLMPALINFVEYMREQVAQGAQRGCAVIVTDGQLFDAAKVKEYSQRIAEEIQAGKLPPLNFVLVGVGSEVDEAQMESICHAEYAGIDHMWCHRVAEEMDEIAQLVAVLVDESMTIASSGRLLDHRDQVIQVYEGRIPAVLEFEVPPGCHKFVLEINGERYEQAIPEEEDHH